MPQLLSPLTTARESAMQSKISHATIKTQRSQINKLFFLISEFRKMCIQSIVVVSMCHYAAAAAKSLQLCPTPSDPMDYSPPGPSVHGIFQARVLESGAIAFSDVSL